MVVSVQTAALVRSAVVLAGAAAPLSPVECAPVLFSSLALYASSLFPVSPSPYVPCQDVAFEIQVAPALSGASVFHPVHEWLEDVVLSLAVLALCVIQVEICFIIRSAHLQFQGEGRRAGCDKFLRSLCTTPLAWAFSSSLKS